MSDASQAHLQRHLVQIPAGEVLLEGNLSIPEDLRGVVVFAHGSGSSRNSPRNRAVADHLHAGHLGTLLFDLLTGAEERIDNATAELRFNVPMLAERLVGAIDWVRQQPGTAKSPLGLFGASTGAGAALEAAAVRDDVVRAVVSRGGRPDLAGEALSRVRAPTLLIVGSRDPAVITLNRNAMEQLRCPARLEIILGATHLFVEEGALMQVAKRAREWFEQHLASDQS
jgi:pimeloyl-ACP methyl ester carboxylesterase